MNNTNGQELSACIDYEQDFDSTVTADIISKILEREECPFFNPDLQRIAAIRAAWERIRTMADTIGVYSVDAQGQRTSKFSFSYSDLSEIYDDIEIVDDALPTPTEKLLFQVYLSANFWVEIWRPQPCPSIENIISGGYQRKVIYHITAGYDLESDSRHFHDAVCRSNRKWELELEKRQAARDRSEQDTMTTDQRTCP